MKVVIVHNAYPQYGGEDTVVANETAMLIKHGFDVVPWIVPTEESGIMNLIRCGLSAVWNPFAARKLSALLQREKPDIVHCHNTFPLLSPSVFAACHAAGVPVVQTIHNYRHICPAGSFFRDGSVCEECLGKKVPWPILKHGCYRNSRIASTVPAMSVYAQRVRHTFKRDVDALIALNNFAKNKLIEGGIPEQIIHIKPNFCLGSEHQARVPRPSDKPFTVCYAGRLSADKGAAVLLDAWKNFIGSLAGEVSSQQKPTVRLVIAGEGELAGRVSSAVEQDETITYRGCLTHKQTVDMIGQSDCLVLPSHLYEGMPMTILEAFSTGTAVIASRIGGIPEIVKEGVNGLLFTPGDPEELTTHLHALYSSSLRLQEMGESAYEVYLARFSEAVNFPLLEQIYLDVIERYARP